MHVASPKPQHGHVPKTDQLEKFENANNDLIYTRIYRNTRFVPMASSGKGLSCWGNPQVTSQMRSSSPKAFVPAITASRKSDFLILLME